MKNWMIFLSMTQIQTSSFEPLLTNYKIITILLNGIGSYFF